MDLDNENVDDNFFDILQDIHKEYSGDYYKKLKSEIKNLRDKIDKRFEEVKQVENKIDKCDKILNSSDKIDSKQKMLVIEWKNYLQGKKKELNPDKLLEKKGKLNTEKKRLKLLLNLSQEF